MTPLFAGTAFFIAFLCADDADHDAATKLAREIRQPVLTTRWILMELGNYLRRPAQRDRVAPFFEHLQTNPNFQVLPADNESFDEGLKLYDERSDKDWSRTDCISFAVMKKHGITDALTTDHHFQQAGFNVLLS